MMPSYLIDYLWTYNPYGDRGPRYFDQEVPLTVRYYIQPDEPDVGVKFDITVEEIMTKDGEPLCTDAAFECGWYQADQDSLEMWLWDGAYADGQLILAALNASTGSVEKGEAK